MGSSSSSFQQAAVGLFTTISSTLFGSLGSSLFGAYRELSEDEEKTEISKEVELELSDLHPVDTPVEAGYLETTGETNSVQNIKEEEKDCELPAGRKHPEAFRQFDMVNDCSDHHFAGKGQQSSQVGCIKDLRLSPRVCLVFFLSFLSSSLPPLPPRGQ